jgi:hypothetical protein
LLSFDPCDAHDGKEDAENHHHGAEISHSMGVFRMKSVVFQAFAGFLPTIRYDIRVRYNPAKKGIAPLTTAATASGFIRYSFVECI